MNPTPIPVDQNTLAIVGVLALVVGPYLKVAIDLLRMAVELPRWAPPAVAFGGAFLLSLMVIGIGYASTPPPSGTTTPVTILTAVCLSVFAALVAAAQAVGVTELQDSASARVKARRARR